MSLLIHPMPCRQTLNRLQSLMVVAKTYKQGSASVEWFEYPTPVRQGLGSIPASVKLYSVRIFDGCHDYSTHDMSDLKRDCKKSDGRTYKQQQQTNNRPTLLNQIIVFQPNVPSVY